jgi:hypothetical protein
MRGCIRVGMARGRHVGSDAIKRAASVFQR